MPLNVGSTGLGGENVYGCIFSTSTFTIRDATKNGSVTCVLSPATSFAGTMPFGEVSSSGSSPVGLSTAAEADLIVANGLLRIKRGSAADLLHCERHSTPAFRLTITVVSDIGVARYSPIRGRSPFITYRISW
jgi:hypothetical protein